MRQKNLFNGTKLLPPKLLSIQRGHKITNGRNVTDEITFDSVVRTRQNHHKTPSNYNCWKVGGTERGLLVNKRTYTLEFTRRVEDDDGLPLSLRH